MTNYQDIIAYLKPLVDAGAEVYLVGGAVRDKLLGLPVKDIDVLTRGLAMKKIMDVLSKTGKIAAVGKSFGIIKYSPHKTPDTTIDIALPRLERSTGTGHRDFEVDFDPSLPVEKDLARRDFTINAMALSLSEGKLIDPFNGRTDLEKRLLRVVFYQAFEEDPLRMIRAVQFAARFGLKIEDKTFELLKKDAGLIETVSGERISTELIKLMGAPRPSAGFNMMHECGLLKFILPELVELKGIEQDKQPGDDVFSHTMRVLDAARGDAEIENKGDLNLLFAALFHDIGKAKTARFHAPSNRIVFFGHQLASARKARKIMERLKSSSAGINPEIVISLIKHHMFETKASFTERAIRRFVAKVSPDIIYKLLDLRLADNRGGKHPTGIKGVSNLRNRIREELSKKPPFGPKDLAVNGHELMKVGIPQGPALGQILKHLVEIVLDNPELNTKEALLAEVKKYEKNN